MALLIIQKGLVKNIVHTFTLSNANPPYGRLPIRFENIGDDFSATKKTETLFDCHLNYLGWLSCESSSECLGWLSLNCRVNYSPDCLLNHQAESSCPIVMESSSRIIHSMIGRWSLDGHGDDCVYDRSGSIIWMVYWMVRVMIGEIVGGIVGVIVCWMAMIVTSMDCWRIVRWMIRLNDSGDCQVDDSVEWLYMMIGITWIAL